MLGFPGSSVVKNLPANAGDVGFIIVLGVSSGEGNSNPLHIFAWKITMDRGAWRPIVHGVTKSQTNLATEQQQEQCVLSVVLQALCLPDLIPLIYLSSLLYNHKGFDLGQT